MNILTPSVISTKMSDRNRGNGIDISKNER